jgi:hypothetical protein
MGKPLPTRSRRESESAIQTQIARSRITTEEADMFTSRITERFLFALPILAIAAAVSTSAAAMDAAQALDACDRNPNCNAQFVDDNRMIEIRVGKNIIYCPATGGDCHCIVCGQKRAGGEGRKGGPRSVAGVLASTSANTSKPGLGISKPSIGTHQPPAAKPPGQGLPQPVKETNANKPNPAAFHNHQDRSTSGEGKRRN